MTIFKYFLAAIAILSFSEAHSTDEEVLNLDGELTKSKAQLLKKHSRLSLFAIRPSTGIANSKYFDDSSLIVSPKTINLNVKSLRIQTSGLEDKHIRQISSFTNLKTLELPANEITDKGINYISKLTQLEKLNLSKNKITDKGLRKLGNMPKLKTLNLSLNEITDEGIEKLKNNKSLKTLVIECTTGISPAKYEEIIKWEGIKAVTYFPSTNFNE
jgi:Leucine-rich repeat (LRR) protein